MIGHAGHVKMAIDKPGMDERAMRVDGADGIEVGEYLPFWTRGKDNTVADGDRARAEVGPTSVAREQVTVGDEEIGRPFPMGHFLVLPFQNTVGLRALISDVAPLYSPSQTRSPDAHRVADAAGKGGWIIPGVG